MTDQQRATFKQQLEALVADLEQRQALHKDESNPVELDQTKVGRLSRMDALQMQQMALEVARRRQEQLTRAKAAVQRCIDADFGVCLECDTAIPTPRLSIDPTNEYCVVCAGKQQNR